MVVLRDENSGGSDGASSARYMPSMRRTLLLGISQTALLAIKTTCMISAHGGTQKVTIPPENLGPSILL